METVGDRLKKLRLARKLSQEQVAQAIGVKQGSYTQLENGLSKTPRSTNLEKYARFYDVSTEYLMTGKGPEQPVGALLGNEAELVLIYRDLTPEGRGYVLGRAKAIHADEIRDRPFLRREDDAPTKPKHKDGH